MIRSIANFARNARFLRKMRVLAFVCFLPACASVTQPIGDWARPPDLALDSSSLENVKVSVKCGLMDDGKIRPVRSPLCSSVTTALTNIGAEVAAKDENPDFTVWYLDTALSASSSNWASGLAFFFTGGIVPIISTSTAEAELRVVDSRGVVLDRSQMRVDEVQAFGWLALTSYLNSPEQRKRKRDLELRFFRFVQNRVYSQMLRLQLTTAAEI